ncbi:hypothetical protein GGI26_004160 [Coemansia sp. RSA 1358]|nr:hypothetical protein GGI26_004160 [Coemansia sp. RSA 1358]
MNRTPTKRRALFASTIATDFSVRYPYAFTSLSISPYGRDVILAGRAGLAVIDLESPLAPPRTIPFSSLWKISGVAWCPNVVHHGWVGTSVNQSLFIHDLAHDTDKPMRVLKSHPMAITDIAWVPKIPSWIGTASIDPVIKIWDVRRDQKPVWYYAEWESADHLTFNNVHMHKMASVHRNKIALWDIRFGSSPLMTMDEAHIDNITSISWHPSKEDIIVSASRDGTVKRWCVEHNNPKEEYCHAFTYEVLSAKYLPFGEGLLVTQKSPDNHVSIIKDDPLLTYVHEFVGHTETVLGSAWRSYRDAGARSTHDHDHQLITWGQDQVLRMWAVDDPVVDAIGGSNCVAHVARENYLDTPSFATNYLGPDQILHLIEQKCLPSDLLKAASVSVGGSSESIGKIATGLGFNTNTIGTSQLITSPEALDESAHREHGMRANTAEEHSSDDGDEEYEREHSGQSTTFAGWRDEVQAIAVDKYHASKTVSVKEISRGERYCRLVIGVPWLTHDTVALRVTFPVQYPALPPDFTIETFGAAFGSSAIIHNRIAELADGCAAHGINSLDHCLHLLISLLITAARAKPPHGQSGHLRIGDIERLPPPPQMPRGGIKSTRDDRYPASTLRSRTSMVFPEDQSRILLSGHRRDRSMSLKNLDRHWNPAAMRSDDGLSIISGGSDGFDGGSFMDDYLLRDDESYRFDNMGESEDEYDEDDDFYLEEMDREPNYLFYDEDGHADVRAGLDGLTMSLRHANTRERFDSHTPFPRLCGGVFSGPGQLLCFFASIYTPETYPEPARPGRQEQAMRKKNREDMCQQLQMLNKPRSMTMRNYYQRIVRFGLEHKGTYLSYGGGDSVRASNEINGNGGGGGSGSAGANGSAGVNGSGGLGGEGSTGIDGFSGFTDPYNDGEARDEEIPRYYFRQQINRVTQSTSGDDVLKNSTYFKPSPSIRVETGVGNMVLICNIPQDKSASYSLAQQFVLTGPNTEWVCMHNANVAALNGRKELADTWMLVACLLGPVPGQWQTGQGFKDKFGHRLWVTHPPILNWLRTVMQHFERQGDVQTLALLSCALSMALSEASDLSSREATLQESTTQSLLDIPPWVKVASAGNNAKGLRVGLASKGRHKMFWGIAGQPYAHFAAASHRDALAQSIPGLHDANNQRTVSFRLPSVSEAGSSGVGTHHSGISSSQMGMLVDGQLMRGVASGKQITRSPTSSPPLRHSDTLGDGLDMSALESVIGRRIDESQRYIHLAGDTMRYQPGIAPQRAELSATPASAMSASLAGYMQGANMVGPLSPVLLREMDNDEIKESELMMAEGMDDFRLPSREQTPDIAKQSSEAYVASCETQASDMTSQQQGDSSELSNGRSPADTTENIWMRLRSNVLGRVHTASGKSNVLDMPATASPVDASAANGFPAGKASSADNTGKQHQHQHQHQQNGSSAAAKGREQRANSGQAESDNLPSWSASHAFMPLLGGMEGVNAQESAKRHSYLRSKWAFERKHTKIAMHAADWDDDHMLVSIEYRSRAPYLDHWKLLYARILYKWGMDIKATEVVKCVQDPVLREIYSTQYCQPTMPQHDNLPRIGNPIIAGQKSKLPEKARHPQKKQASDSMVAVSKPLETVGRRRLSRPDPVDEVEPKSDTETDMSMDISGAPWLTCTWCHEYVHGRALICHACGHGGHQEHMLRWFRIVRKQLMRSGLAPPQYARASTSNNSSMSSLLRQTQGSGQQEAHLASSSLLGYLDGVSRASSPALDDLDDHMSSVSGLLSPVTKPSFEPAFASGGREAEPLGALEEVVHRRFSASESAQSERNGAESSDNESDHLQPLPGLLANGNQYQDSDVFFTQQGIPTCPAGCGCNCLYESHKLIFY